jgi:ribosomal protein S12 methylthiotransferase
MRQKHRQRVHVVTMGCAKNLVDSEKLMAQLRLNDIEIVPTLDQAQVAIINTCGFIDAAKEESVDMVVEHLRRKKSGQLQKVYAMGCLTERYRSELKKELPELDGIYGTQQMKEIVQALGGHLRTELLGERVLTTPSHTAYIKVSEGCDRPCSFCAIPLMRGKHVSRPMADILDEAQLLVAHGVKELIVIGQDTTAYGTDTHRKRMIGNVLNSLSDIHGLEWIRLMYAYPAQFPLGVLDVLAENPHICKYLDIPIQHIADGVLRSMRRGITRRALEDLLGEIRQRVPGIALRTTLIVGYPAEGPAEFDELLGFVESFRFERLGVFTYSREEGTAAHDHGDPVSVKEKVRRRDLVMELQQEISEDRNASLIGSRQRILLDRKEDDRWFGRTEHDAPEIDNEVIIDADDELSVGTFHTVEIVDAVEYDLHGRIVP